MISVYNCKHKYIATIITLTTLTTTTTTMTIIIKAPTKDPIVESKIIYFSEEEILSL